MLFGPMILVTTIQLYPPQDFNKPHTQPQLLWQWSQGMNLNNSKGYVCCLILIPHTCLPLCAPSCTACRFPRAAGMQRVHGRSQLARQSLGHHLRCLEAGSLHHHQTKLFQSSLGHHAGALSCSRAVLWVALASFQ